MSLTNGDAGHQLQHGEEFARRRRAEALEAGRRIGIEYEVLDNHDGKLLPTLEVRETVFLYYSDRFRRPQPFHADIVVSIDDVFEKKIDMLDAHVSQVYEWLPWTEGRLEQVPQDHSERKKWLAATSRAERELQPEWRAALEKRYGAQAVRVQNAEAFEITEYGRQPTEEEIRRLFPFFPEAALRP